MSIIRTVRNLGDVLFGEQESREIDPLEAGELLHNGYFGNRYVTVCASYGMQTEGRIQLFGVDELIQDAKRFFLEPHHLHYDLEVRWAPDRLCFLKLPNDD